jgi:hypothetical protein
MRIAVTKRNTGFSEPVTLLDWRTKNVVELPREAPTTADTTAKDEVSAWACRAAGATGFGSSRNGPS